MPTILSKLALPPPSSLIRLLRLSLNGIFLFSTCFALNLLQIASLLFKPLNAKKVYAFNGRLAGIMWYLMQRVVEVQNGTKITFSGADIPVQESAIIIANHKSYADFYLIHALAARRRMLFNCKYMAKDSLKYIPFFGWGIWMMGMIMVKRNWLLDQAKIKAAFRTLATYREPVWMIVYPEGTRFTPQKHLQSLEFAKSRNLPSFQHLLLPRTKGIVQVIKQLRQTHVQHIYDFTLVYKDHDAPDIVQVNANTTAAHVHVKRFSLDELPEDEAELSAWVLNLWQEKELYLQQTEQNKREEAFPSFLETCFS